MPCPSNMVCQTVLSSMSQFCVPCQCNLIPDDATCNDNCISNVCVPSTTSSPTTPLSCESFIIIVDLGYTSLVNYKQHTFIIIVDNSYDIIKFFNDSVSTNSVYIM